MSDWYEEKIRLASLAAERESEVSYLLGLKNGPREWPGIGDPEIGIYTAKEIQSGYCDLDILVNGIPSTTFTVPYPINEDDVKESVYAWYKGDSANIRKIYVRPEYRSVHVLASKEPGYSLLSEVKEDE